MILQSYNLSQKSREKRKLRAGVWPRAQCREPPQVVATAHTSRGSSRWALLSSHFHLSFLARPPVPARTFKKKKEKAALECICLITACFLSSCLRERRQGIKPVLAPRTPFPRVRLLSLALSRPTHT